jgi:transcriptional regulator with XRE-family HTH domain
MAGHIKIKRQHLLIRLGERLKAYRLEKGFSQEALAEIASFDRTYISLLERGKRSPSFTNLCRIAKALNVPASEIVRGISL